MPLPPPLADVPRLDLAGLPTPLTLLERFSEAIGVEVWCKRDDVGAPALAGNKVRKLEYLLAEALAAGADTIVTTGAVQSNSARAAASAAAAVGMRAVLVLAGEDPGSSTANLLVDRLVGAEIRFVGEVGWDRLDALVEEVAEEVARRGGVPFTAPVGCSTPQGALGLAAAYHELLEQLDEAGAAPARVYHASTSGGTHAGLVLGRALAGRGPAPIAVSAGRVHDDPSEHHRRLVRDAGRLLGRDVEVEVEVRDDQVGDGYGIPTRRCLEAIRLLARTEGILADPVYSAKGLAALVADAGQGGLDSPVVFWHTGGWQALFDPGASVLV